MQRNESQLATLSVIKRSLISRTFRECLFSHSGIMQILRRVLLIFQHPVLDMPVQLEILEL